MSLRRPMTSVTVMPPPTTSDGWFDWILHSEPSVPSHISVTQAAVRTTDDVCVSLAELSLLPPVPALAPATAPSAVSARVSQAANCPMRLVCGVGDVFGDEVRFQAALQRVQSLAARAQSARGCQYVVGVLGNVAPTRHPGTALEEVVRLQRRQGAGDLSGGLVELIMGRSELALLRLRDRGEFGEMARASPRNEDASTSESGEWQQAALGALCQLAPVPEGGLPKQWQAHNDGCKAAFLPLRQNAHRVNADTLAIALLVKLASMLTRMLHAEHMLNHAIQRLSNCNACALDDFAGRVRASSSWSMLETFEALTDVTGEDAQKKVSQVAEAARHVVNGMVDWATSGLLHEYATKAKLVAFVPALGSSADCTADSALRDKGFWMLSRGTGTSDGESIVGRTLRTASGHAEGFRVAWGDACTDKTPRAWADSLNEQFQTWLSDTDKRLPPSERNVGLSAAFAALGCTKSDSGPTGSNADAPLAGLGDDAVGMLGGSALPSPLGGVRATLDWGDRNHRDAQTPAPRARWTVGTDDEFAPSASFALGTFSVDIASRMHVREAHPAPRAEEEPSGEPGCGPRRSLRQTVTAVENAFLDAEGACDSDLQGLRGVVGPRIVNGHFFPCEAMRATWWTCSGADGGVLALLPDDFITGCLDEHTRPFALPHGTAALTTEGVLVLPVSGLIRVEDGSDADDPTSEAPLLAWRLGTAPTLEARPVCVRQPSAACTLPVYETQEQAQARLEAVRLGDHAELGAGAPFGPADGASMHLVATSSSSSLEGLTIRFLEDSSTRRVPVELAREACTL